MAKQTLVIETAKELSLRGGMIVITDKETGEISLRPIEDVQLIMLDHHSAKITIPLISRLAMNNASVIYCNESHMPVSMTMDLESNTLQAKRFREQLGASVPTNKQIWKQIVEAKILNQSLLLEILGKGENVLTQYYKNVKSGDSTNREGIAANVYWKKLLGNSFIRDRFGKSPNHLLNYGYALLRSVIARHLMNAGLLPTIGIFHRNRYNAFPLADDMMEPFRPYIDRKVVALMESKKTELCRETKKILLDTFYTDIPANSILMSAATLAGIYEGSCKVVVFPQIQ